jgi:transcriptional regulator with XRE-family HTH domain
MAQDDWQAQLTGVVAGEIRRYRQERKMSAQQLANRCEQLGFAIPRPVISNIENGRRDSLSIAELLVLARALDVAPALLVAPVGRQEMVEILPDQSMPPFDAVRWLEGEQLRETADGLRAWVDPDAADDPLFLFRWHRGLVLRWLAAQKALVEPQTHREQWIAEMHEQLADDLRRVRSLMRSMDLIPPPLPPGLGDIEQDPAL